ncbi:MAG: AAA family ATPase, partial [Porticoccaceae bacterium]|nr:AAA family ATPase [Porticoccaceae bacterium]
LHYISPDQPYDEWIRLGMAIHHCTGGGGFALWDQWSAKGSKYPGHDQLERHWHSFGKSAHPAGYGSVVAMARAGGYIEPVTFEYVPTDEVQIKEAEKEKEPQPKPLTKQDQWLHSLMESDDAALERVMNMEYLIDGVLPEDGFAALVGASGTGKSFVGLDIACSVATGKQWHGLDSQRGLVVYISAEGANGLRRRKRGWEQHHGTPAPLMRILPAAPLLDSADALLLSTVVQQAAKYTGERVKLVVVDTVNRTMSGDENSASDMANFVRGCQVVQQDNQCAVLVIHHSGHGDKERARGSSAFFAALDMEIFLKPIGADIVELINTKNKDAESFQPMRLSLCPVTLEGIVDRKGRPVVTLVASKASLGQELQAAQFSLTDRQRALLDMIEMQCVEAGERVPRADIRAQFSELFDSAVDPATIRKAMHDALAALVEKKCVRTTKTDIELLAFSRC